MYNVTGYIYVTFLLYFHSDSHANSSLVIPIDFEVGTHDIVARLGDWWLYGMDIS